MPKETREIKLSKMLTIKIGDDMKIIDYICNWNLDNDDISIYSERISFLLNGKKQYADMIKIYYGDGKVDTVFYMIYLLVPTLIPSKKKRKRRKSENKIGDWCCILFSKENFDAEICDELGNDTATVEINSLMTYECIKYANMKLSEFLETENAKYIRDPYGCVNPRDPRYNWQT